MTHRILFMLIIIFTHIALYAQDTTCNCLQNLTATISKTEANYAGYPAKVTGATRPAYNRLVQRLQKKATPETATKKCFYILKEYIQFFKDKHFVLAYTNRNDFDSAVLPYSEAHLHKQAANKKASPLEGLWISPDTSTKIAILKSSDGTFKAVKVASKNDSYPVGFVYFTLTPHKHQYIVKEYNAFSSTNIPAKQRGNLLQLWGYALWGKVYPQQMSAMEAIELASWRNNNHGLAFKKLNQNTAYLKVPTFMNNDQAIEQLVAQNDSIIRSTKYLVVDLSGNSGGNTGWVSFLPYFMTNTVVQKPALVRVTPDNVKLKMPDLELFVKKPITAEYKKYFPDSILRKFQIAFEELPTTNKPFYPASSVNFPLDSITQNPKKIALIVDNFCGSSAEYFFSLTKQSHKTISYGQNTVGMMDYQGMSTPTPLPYTQFRLTIPIAKSSWTDTQPIDQTGFKPDVLLTAPQRDWIEFVVNDLPKR